MGEVSHGLPRETVGDVACSLLRELRRPLPIKDLIAAIAARGVVRAETPARTAAIIHTEINLDGRLQHMGGGLWGLRQWAPRRKPEPAPPPPEWAEEEGPALDEPGSIWPEDGDRWDE